MSVAVPSNVDDQLLQENESNVVENVPNAETPAAEKPIEEFLYYDFKVHGISFREKAIIKELADENDDYFLTKSELIDYGMICDRIYKYKIISNKIDLLPEDNNPHDENAVKVIADNVHIGYVPASKAKRVRRILEKENIVSITCDFYGGPYKDIDSYYTISGNEKYELSTGDMNIGAKVVIKYKNRKFK